MLDATSGECIFPWKKLGMLTTFPLLVGLLMQWRLVSELAVKLVSWLDGNFRSNINSTDIIVFFTART